MLVLRFQRGACGDWDLDNNYFLELIIVQWDSRINSVLCPIQAAWVQASEFEDLYRLG